MFVLIGFKLLRLFCIILYVLVVTIFELCNKNDNNAYIQFLNISHIAALRRFNCPSSLMSMQELPSDFFIKTRPFVDQQ